MQRVFLIIFLSTYLLPIAAFTQNENFAGTWQMKYNSPGASPILIELKIAEPEKGLLYPAQLSFQSNEFTGVYELLLVKKSSRELAISRNKFAVQEIPFSLGNKPWYLNGIFDFSKDMKGEPSLNIIRINSKAITTIWPDSILNDKSYLATANQLEKLLREAAISLKKISNNPWVSANTGPLLQPTLSPAYFGLNDTLIVQTRQGNLSITGIRKKENDIVTVALNGNSFINLHGLDKKKYNDYVTLDTGINLLALYAENFGNEEPNKGALEMEFNSQIFTLDFKNKADSAANFILVKLYYAPDISKDIYFRSHGYY